MTTINPENDYRMFPIDEETEGGCITLALFLNNFSLDDSLDEEEEFLTRAQECEYWHHIMYSYCGLCPEPPVRASQACTYPCEYDETIVRDDSLITRENLACPISYIESLVLTDSTEHDEYCTNLLADASDCCVETSTPPPSSSTRPTS